MEAACPNCSKTYFVDENKVPVEGGLLTCPGCSKQWRVFRPSMATAPPQGGLPSIAVTTGPVPARGRPAAPRIESQVTCPKCGHRFAPSPPAPAPAPGAGARRRILLVEDQKYFTEVVRETLAPEFQTISVGTPEEALKVIKSEPPSLMILDLNLARGQDGRDLLRAIPQKQFPILIFTARDESELFESWDELKALGADDIVRKTMDVGEELRKKVAELLQG